MARVKNDEAGNDEEQIDAAAAIGQHKGDRALGHLVAVGGDAKRMKGDDGERRDKPENLDMDEHRFSLTRRGRRLKRKTRRSGRRVPYSAMSATRQLAACTVSSRWCFITI